MFGDDIGGSSERLVECSRCHRGHRIHTTFRITEYLRYVQYLSYYRSYCKMDIISIEVRYYNMKYMSKIHY